MTRRRMTERGGFGLAMLSGLPLSLIACSDDSSEPTPPAIATGGQMGVGGQGATGGGIGTTGGTTSGGSGGATGGSGGDTAGASGKCTPIMLTGPALNDFSAVDGTFGDFSPGTLSGGPYVYPGDGDTPLMDDFSTGAWNITGMVGTYSGFGIYLNCIMDASMYDGIQFMISAPMESPARVNFIVRTANDDPPGDPMSAHEWGACVVADPANADASCHSAGKFVDLTTTPTLVKVSWAELTGGIPMPNPDPAKIIEIQWQIDWPEYDPSAEMGGMGGMGGGDMGGGGAAGDMGGGGAAGDMGGGGAAGDMGGGGAAGDMGGGGAAGDTGGGGAAGTSMATLGGSGAGGDMGGGGSGGAMGGGGSGGDMGGGGSGGDMGGGGGGAGGDTGGGGSGGDTGGGGSGGDTGGGGAGGAMDMPFAINIVVDDIMFFSGATGGGGSGGGGAGGDTGGGGTAGGGAGGDTAGGGSGGDMGGGGSGGDMGGGGSGGATASAACMTYCTGMAATCTGGNQQFADDAACLAACALYPSGAADGADTLECRMTHLTNAMNSSPMTHCPHAGADGGGVCVD